MSREPVGPMPSDLRALVEGAERPPLPPAEAAARVATRLEQTLGVAGLAPVHPPAGRVAGLARLGGAGRAGGARGLAGLLAAKPLVTTLAALTLGGAVGTGAVVAVGRHHERGAVAQKVEEPRPASRAVPSPPVRAASPRSVEVPVEVPVAPRPVRARAPEEVPAAVELDTLPAERPYIEAARDALARGDAGPALTALAEHEKAFPHGALAEERDGLRVQALVVAGRYDEARARAAAFVTAYPTSIFRPVVERSLQAIP